MMSRLFTFGCSFTKYHYPTWADIVGSCFNEYQNWARGSAGNNFILSSLQECHARNNLTAADTVIILFAPLTRYDYYQFENWHHEVNAVHKLHSQDLFSCPRGVTVQNYSWMSCVVEFLQSAQTNYQLFSWSYLEKNDVYSLYAKNLDQIIETRFYNKAIYPLARTISEEVKLKYRLHAGDDWPNLNEILNNNFKGVSETILKEIKLFQKEYHHDRSVFGKDVDHHPSPKSHLQWVKQYLPQYQIRQEMIDIVNELDHRIQNKVYYEYNSNEPTRF